MVAASVAGPFLSAKPAPAAMSTTAPNDSAMIAPVFLTGTTGCPCPSNVRAIGAPVVPPMPGGPAWAPAGVICIGWPWGPVGFVTAPAGVIGGCPKCGADPNIPRICPRSMTSVACDAPKTIWSDSANSFALWKRPAGSRDDARTHQASNECGTSAICDGMGRGWTMIFISRSPSASLSNGSWPVMHW